MKKSPPGETLPGARKTVFQFALLMSADLEEAMVKSEPFALLFIPVLVYLGMRADIRRRRLSFRRRVGWKLRTVLDVLALVIAMSVGTFLLTQSGVATAMLLSFATIWFLWSEGKKQVKLQRPSGLVFGELCVLFGAYLVFFHRSNPSSLRFAPVAAGVAMIGTVVPQFIREREEHRILEDLEDRGEAIQEEWVSPTPECPYPEQWRMLDAQSAEIEVLDFLQSLVMTIKPDLIVETGTFIGHSSISMAKGLKANGFGRLITVEFDPAVCEKADQNIRAAGLDNWIEARCLSSLELTVDGEIDLLYSDSDLTIREAEVRRFLPQIRRGGLVVIHDASSSFHLVREAALRLQEEGLLSVLLLGTPRGLVIAQKLEGRK